MGTQAVLNVVTGERYKMVTKETKGMLTGEYGKLPIEPKPAVIKQIIGDAERMTCRPADRIEPELDKLREPPKIPQAAKPNAQTSTKTSDKSASKNFFFISFPPFFYIFIG